MSLDLQYRSIRAASVRRSCESGTVLMEFALVLPMLALILLSSLEIARSLRHVQAASVFSREAASMAYRECQNLDALRTRLCLREVVERIQEFASETAPDSRVIVSVYEDADPDGSGRYRRLGMHPHVPARRGFRSRFSIDSQGQVGGQAGSQSAGPLRGPLEPETIDRHRIVVISEAYVPYNPWFGSLTQLFHLENGAFYDATII